MAAVDDFGNRVGGVFEGLFISTVAGAFALVGEALSEATEPTGSTVTDGTLDLLLFTIQNYPLFITIGGFLFVIVAAGPFGFFGFILEIIGLNSLLAGTPGGFWLICFGAGIIVIGRELWSWENFLGSSNSSYSRRI